MYILFWRFLSNSFSFSNFVSLSSFLIYWNASVCVYIFVLSVNDMSGGDFFIFITESKANLIKRNLPEKFFFPQK